MEPTTSALPYGTATPNASSGPASSVLTRPLGSGNLDSQNGAAVMDPLAELNGAGTTIMMATHSASDAEYAQRVVNLLDGRVVSEHMRAGEAHMPDPSTRGVMLDTV